MSFDVRRCRDLAEYDGAFMSIAQYFGNEPDPERAERFSRLLPVERMHAAWEDGLVVGGAGAFPFKLSVPGGALQCAGTTVVGVAPTHRRRGVLRSMMRAHLDDAHERGEPLAALWASEESIYARFGYGIAGFAGEVEIPKEYVGFVAPPERTGRLRLVERDEALEAFPALWEALGRDRPGVFTRSRDWWELRTLDDPPARRDGAGPKRLALLERDGAPAAYAIYRHKMDWEAGVSKGKVVVIEAVGVDPEAVAEIWRFLLDIDWVATITSWLVPPDHPLFFILAHPRRMRYRLGRRALGAAGRRRRGALRPDVSRGRRDRLRGARHVLRVEPGQVAPRRRRGRAHGRGGGPRARRHFAGCRVSGRHGIRAAGAGRQHRGAQVRSDPARGRHLPPRPPSLVPGDLLGRQALG